MALSHEPVFTQNGKTVCAVATDAKTTYNDSANAVKLCDAGADGSLIKGVLATPNATVTATKLMLFVSPDNGVTMFQLPVGAVMAAYTMAGTTASPVTTVGSFSDINPLRLQSGWSLWCAIGVALAAGIVFAAQVEGFS